MTNAARYRDIGAEEYRAATMSSLRVAFLSGFVLVERDVYAIETFKLIPLS